MRLCKESIEYQVPCEMLQYWVGGLENHTQSSFHPDYRLSLEHIVDISGQLPHSSGQA